MNNKRRPVRPQPFEQASSATQIQPIGPSATMNSTSQNNNFPSYQPEQQQQPNQWGAPQNNQWGGTDAPQNDQWGGAGVPQTNQWGGAGASQVKGPNSLSDFKKTGLLSNSTNYLTPGGGFPGNGMFGGSEVEEQPTSQNNFGNLLSPKTNPTSPFFNPGAGMPQQGGSGMLEQSPSPFSMGGMPTAAVTRSLNDMSPALDRSNSGMLPAPIQPGGGNTVKLTGPMRVVQMPVAGRPGQYVTGFLPVLPPAAEVEEPEKPPMGKKMKIVSAVLVALLLIGATAGIISLRSHSNQQDTGNQGGTSNTLSQADMAATAAAQGNILLSDPLSQDIHSWPISPSSSYAFKNGAYHISSSNGNASAAVMQDIPFNGSFSYSLMLQEVKGDDTSNTNTFGMIVRYSNSNGKSKFYCFQVSNEKGGEYQFFKYDKTVPDNNNDPNYPWTNLWHHSFGKEFHEGHGPKVINNFKISVNGSKYTFVVNGKTVGSASDGGLKGGMIGMLVNQNGTEVAFSNLLVTQK